MAMPHPSGGGLIVRTSHIRIVWPISAAPTAPKITLAFRHCLRRLTEVSGPPDNHGPAARLCPRTLGQKQRRIWIWTWTWTLIPTQLQPGTHLRRSPAPCLSVLGVSMASSRPVDLVAGEARRPSSASSDPPRQHRRTRSTRSTSRPAMPNPPTLLPPYRRLHRPVLLLHLPSLAAAAASQPYRPSHLPRQPFLHLQMASIPRPLQGYTVRV